VLVFLDQITDQTHHSNLAVMVQFANPAEGGGGNLLSRRGQMLQLKSGCREVRHHRLLAQGSTDYGANVITPHA